MAGFDRSAVKDANVMFGGKATAVSKLTDQQLLSALTTNAANRGALAAGWYVDNGQVFKRQVATPTAQAPKPATPTAAAPTTKPTTVKPLAQQDPRGPAFNTPPIAPKPQDPRGPAFNTPPVGSQQVWKVGQKMADGQVFAGWMKRGDKYVPLVKTKNGGSAIHPAWQNGKNGEAYLAASARPTNDKGPPTSKPPAPGLGGGAGGGGAVQPGAPVTPAPTTPAPPAGPTLSAPGWIQNLFPTIGAGFTTNPNAGGAVNGWSPNFAQQMAEWNAASAVDGNYAQAYSAALLEAMQGLQPLQAEVQGLLARDPITGLTRYQSELRQLNRTNRANTSSAYGNAAARGLSGRGGNTNSALAELAASYAPALAGVQQTHGDARLAALGQQVAAQILGLNMNLVGAYQQAVGNAYSNLPGIGQQGG